MIYNKPTENPEARKEMLSQIYEVNTLSGESKEDIKERFEKGEIIFWIMKNSNTNIFLWSLESKHFHVEVARNRFPGDTDWSGGRLSKKGHREAERNNLPKEQFDAVEYAIRNFLNE